jgi:hypothetical protein
MKRLAATAFIVLVVLGSAVDSRTEAQNAGSIPPKSVLFFNRITAQELNLLLSDVAESNPMVLKRFEEDPEAKRAQLDSLRQLLAFATEAKNTGLADIPRYQTELEFIRAETTAVNYDIYVNKGKPKRGPFGYITAEAVATFWGEAPGSTLSPTLKAERKARFERFLDTKVALLRETSPQMSEREIGPDEIAQARDIFGKTQIYLEEYSKRAPLLPVAFRQKVDLQVKLQQAQFLARLYSEKAALETAASDVEVASYIEEHPELDTSMKRAVAEKLLARAKSGENFARLANEFSEDPGNKNATTGQLNGGLYKNVGLGVMVAPFEKAAIALEAGQISPELVESDHGFHVIKLERKSSTEPRTYDVRHILIATGVSDPDNPLGPSVPVKEHARKVIEAEKEQEIIDRIVAENNISVPDDFVIPAVKLPVAPKAAPKRKPRATRKRT